MGAFAVGLGLVLTAGGSLCLRAVLAVDRSPAPDRVALGLLLGGSAVGLVVGWTRPPESGFSLAMFVVVGRWPGLSAGCEDRRVVVARSSAVSAVLLMRPPAASFGLAAYAAAVAAFLVFTVRSSLWLLGVVSELETGRGAARPPWPWPRSGCASPATCTTCSAGGSRRSPCRPSSPRTRRRARGRARRRARSLEVRAHRPRGAARGARAGPRLPARSTSTRSSRAPGLAAALGRHRRRRADLDDLPPSRGTSRSRGSCARRSPTCCATPRATRVDHHVRRRRSWPSATTGPRRRRGTRRAPGWSGCGELARRPLGARHRDRRERRRVRDVDLDAPRPPARRSAR